MFSMIVMFITAYWAVQMKSIFFTISRNSAFIFATLLTFLFLIYSFQTLGYSPVNSSGFFALISPDGQRYLDEAVLFECPWCINELRGEYWSEDNYYSSTPKMGLSGYISIASFGWEPDIFTAYGLLLIAVLVGGFIKIKLIECFRISNGAKVILAIIVVLFPTDLYFTLRFLREPVANDLFSIGLLLICLHHFNGRHSSQLIKALPLIIASLILWRTQLALVLSVASIALLPLNRRSIAIIAPLAFLSLFQMVRAVSVLSLSLQLNSEIAYNVFWFVIQSREIIARFDAVLFILPLSLSVLFPLSFKGLTVSNKRFVVVSIGIVIPWLIADLGQIRFMYPAIIWLKCAVFVTFAHGYRMRFKVKKSSAVMRYGNARY